MLLQQALSTPNIQSSTNQLSSIELSYLADIIFSSKNLSRKACLPISWLLEKNSSQ
jgi:hypothetical protein